MFGTRDLFSKCEKINDVAAHRLECCVDQLLQLPSANDNLKFASEPDKLTEEYKKILENILQEASQIFYLRRLYQQAKQLSQIVAYIWRWADTDETPQKDVANKLKEYFTNPTEDNQKPGGKLKELLRADPRKTENLNEEDKLLKSVFLADEESNDSKVKDNLIFPMFDKFELGEEFPELGYLFQVNLNSFHGTLDDPTKNAPELMKFNIPYPPCPKIGNATVTLDELEDWIANRETNEYFAQNPYIPTSCS